MPHCEHRTCCTKEEYIESRERESIEHVNEIQKFRTYASLEYSPPETRVSKGHIIKWHFENKANSEALIAIAAHAAFRIDGNKFSRSLRRLSTSRKRARKESYKTYECIPARFNWWAHLWALSRACVSRYGTMPLDRHSEFWNSNSENQNPLLSWSLNEPVSGREHCAGKPRCSMDLQTFYILG